MMDKHGFTGKYSGKMQDTLRLRVPDRLGKAIRSLAMREDRTIMGQVRHLIKLGLKYEEERLRTEKRQERERREAKHGH